MASCLGMYIEHDLIKYAKVTKDREMLKVDAFGIKFYDQIGPAINQIIQETYSYKTPISINLSEEVYQYFYFFNLLQKNDLKKAIETEFDSYCFEKGYQRNALETRYALVPDMQDNEKIKAIYISVNKAEINRRIQEFSNNSFSSISPLPLAISNIADIKEKENIAIVNIENTTTVTTVIDGKIYNVDKVDEGMDTILSMISEKENSYAKAYEICKNTTIYTMEGKELSQGYENLYLEDIMPTLYTIVQSVKAITDDSLNKIEKIYITGTGCVINNIDLYFQEYFGAIKCEILRPYFISENVKINIKDYIEVNSAIALAMQGLGYGIKKINFKNPGLMEQLPDFLKLDIGSKKKDKEEGNTGNKKLSKFNFNFNLNLNVDWKAHFDNTERWLTRVGTGILIFTIAYIALASYIKQGIDEKSRETSEVKNVITSQISAIDSDTTKLKNKTSSYQQMIDSLTKYSNEVQDNLSTKNAIPILLTRIMNIIPKGVTVTSIENTQGSQVVINAQSSQYDLIGIFKGSIIVNGVLKPDTVTSSKGEKQDGIIKIEIRGELP